MKRIRHFFLTLTAPWSLPQLLPLRNPQVTMLPNPCLPSDTLTLHLRGLRRRSVQVRVLSKGGELVVEHQITPRSNHHRQPLALPRATPPGMYCCVATQEGSAPVQAWVALQA